jgi:hypothetical protein
MVRWRPLQQQQQLLDLESRLADRLEGRTHIRTQNEEFDKISKMFSRPDNFTENFVKNESICTGIC